MQRVKFSLACLLCVSWAISASAQTELENDTGIAVMQDFSGGVSLGSGAYINIQHLSGPGVGYTNGYTNLGAFIPYWVDEDTMIAPNGRMWFTNNSTVGGSVGGVFRRYLPDSDRIFGFNAFFDFDETSDVRSYDYTQFGFGFESLGNFLDFRSNVYLPTSTESNFIQALSLGSTPTFTGNGINFIGVGEFQEAVRGADVEVGVPVTESTPWLRAYAGLYGYSATGADPIGVRARLEAVVSNDLTVGVNVTEDNRFGTNVNAVVDFRFSGFQPTRYFPQLTTRDRMTTAVQRNGRIATANYADNVLVPAINPGTGLPYFVVWVDNSNLAPGDGSFENPYRDFQPSQPYPGADLILVRRGISDIFPLNGPVQLFDNQRLLGEGRSHQIVASAQFEQIHGEGTYFLPGFFDNGLYPTITAPGDIITIANNNEVSGFNLINAGGSAITNIPFFGSNNFNINCVDMTGNQRGIFLQNTSGIGIVSGSNALDNFDGGIAIVNNGPLNLLIQDVTSNSSVLGNQAVGIELTASNSPLQVTMNNVSTIANGVGTRINALNSDVVAIFNTVNTTGNVSDGLQAQIDGGSLALAANSLNASANFQDNIDLQFTNGARMDLVFSLVDASSSFGGNGISIFNNGGTGTAFLGTVNASGNFGNGFIFQGDNGANIQGAISGNTLLNNNGQDGIQAIANNLSIVSLTGDGINATGNGSDGLFFSATGNSFLDLGFNNTQFDNSGQTTGGNAVNGINFDSVVMARFNNVTGNNSGGDGFSLLSVNGFNDLRIFGGSFSNSGQFLVNSAGMDIFATNASNVLLNIGGVALSNDFTAPATQADGLRLSSNFASNIVANLDEVDLTSNLDNAVDVTVATNGTATVNMVNSDGSFSGFSGLRIDAQTGGQLQVVADASPFFLSGANGIDAFVRSDADVFLEFRNFSDILASGQNGVMIDIADAGSTFVGQFNDVNISESGFNFGGVGTQDAIHVVATDQAQVDLNLVNTPTTNLFFNAQQRGLFASLQTGAVLNFNNLLGDMSINTMNAMAVAVANPGSVANLNILGTPMNGSGETGFLWFVSDSGAINANIIASTLDGSGAGGVQGHGIEGVATTGGMVNLSLLASPVTNALQDAVNIVGTDLGTTVNATFDASPLDNAGESALDLAFFNGAAGIITLQNGSTGLNAGLEAVKMVADGVAGGVNTSLTVNAFDGDFSDSGQVIPSNGIDVTVSQNANAQLNVINTPVTNTAGTSPQLRGLFFNVLSGGNFDANFINSDLSNHDLEGINGLVDGFNLTDSRAFINLDNTPVDGNVLNGAIFNVTNRGDLIVVAGNGTSFQNNGATGILANVDGALSTATFVLNDVAVDNNGLLVGGDGLNVAATNAATFNILANNSSFSNNANRGISLLTTTASTGFARFNTPTVNNNQEEGMYVEANTASTLRTVVVGGSLSDNGLAGGINNVNVIATQSSIVENFFSGVTADNSTLNGFSFDVGLGSILLAQMGGDVSASNNANGNGVRFIARDAFTQGVLYMEGDNVFDSNGTAVVGTNVAPQSGAGVFFDANGVDIAAIRFAGGASNNGNLANLFSDVDGDGDSDDDGVYVNIRNTNLAAAEFAGTGTISGNVGDGIDLQLTNLGTVGTVTQPSFITPPNVVIGAGNNGIAIDNLTVDGNTGNGISIVVDNVNMTGNISVTNSESSNNGGDGLLIDLNNVTGTPSITIAGNGINTNAGNGVNLSLLNSSINELNILNNTAAAAPVNAVGALVAVGSFGNDQGIQNTSGAGINITALRIDMTAPDFYYDSVNPGAAFPFDPDDAFGPFGAGVIGDTATTGLTSIDGQPVDPGVVPLANGGVPYPGGGKIDDLNTLDLTWNDFNPGEIYDWSVDMDTESQTAGGISGSDLFTPIVGDPTWTGPATVTVTFSTGDVITVPFMADPGDPFAAIAEIIPAAVMNGGISGNGLNGVVISQVNSNIESVNIDNNLIDGNGTAAGAGNGSGINFATVQNSTLADPAGGLNRFNVSNNTITNNDGDGFRLVNPTTAGQTSFDITFDTNTVSTNTGTGINLTMLTGMQNLGSVPQVGGHNIDFLNNTVNGNTGGPGVNLVLADNRNFSGNFNGNTINGNAAEGVNFAPGLNGQIVANFTNNTINGNASHGIDVPLQLGGRFTSNAFYGNTIGTAASRNGGMGVNLVVPNNAQFNWTLGDTAGPANSIGGNTDAGVGIRLSGNATGNLTVQNSSFSNSVAGGGNFFGGAGLGISQTDTTVMNNITIGDVAVNNTSFNSNAGDGLQWHITANAQMLNPVIRNITANANTGDGANFLRMGNGVVDNVTINNSVFTGNSDGLDIGAQFALLVDEYTITNNTFDLNNANGIRMNAQADARINTILQNNTITRSGQDGVNISTVAISPGDVAEVFSGLGAWTNNIFDSNGRLNGSAGAGIEISGFHTITLGNAAQGNFIRGNAGDGIEINAPGSLTVQNAIITGNVLEGSADGRAGIDLNSPGGNSLIVLSSVISNNLGDGIEVDITGGGTLVSINDSAIQFNDRDGVEWMDRGISLNQLNINGSAVGSNVISDNGFRGVDIAVAGFNPSSRVSIGQTDILRNGQEGVYVVLSSDANQTLGAARDAVASVALQANGAIQSTPFLTFGLGNSRVNQNGQVPGTFGGSGLVMRVGTTRGGDGFTTAGGFATGGNGGVVANVLNNSQMTGNFGADVIFQSFTSTVNPNTSGGSWSDQNTNPRDVPSDTFQVNGNFQSDPLARLDLVFQNNTGDELDVTRVGASYNNDEPVFKSRTQNQDNGTDGGADDDGPFGTGTRARNAQRLAARNVDAFFNAGTKLNPDLTIFGVSGNSDNFLFSGLGQSTFRVNESGNSFVNTALGNGFILDDFAGDPFGNAAIYDSFFEARGNGGGGVGGGSTGPFGIDTMPWGWATLP